MGHAIGRLLIKLPSSRFLAFLAGLAILRVLALIPVVGGLAFARSYHAHRQCVHDQPIS
jgi:hypothetical protein